MLGGVIFGALHLFPGVAKTIILSHFFFFLSPPFFRFMGSPTAVNSTSPFPPKIFFLFRPATFSCFSWTQPFLGLFTLDETIYIPFPLILFFSSLLLTSLFLL